MIADLAWIEEFARSVTAGADIPRVNKRRRTIAASKVNNWPPVFGIIHPGGGKRAAHLADKIDPGRHPSELLVDGQVKGIHHGCIFMLNGGEIPVNSGQGLAAGMQRCWHGRPFEIAPSAKEGRHRKSHK